MPAWGGGGGGGAANVTLATGILPTANGGTGQNLGSSTGYVKLAAGTASVVASVGLAEIGSVDFTALGSITISSGANTVGGVTWTAANVAASSTFAISATNGMRIIHGASSTDYYQSTRTGPIISVPIRSIAPTYDCGKPVILDVQLAYSLANNYESPRFGFEHSSSPTQWNAMIDLSYDSGLATDKIRWGGQLTRNQVQAAAGTPTQVAPRSDDVGRIILHNLSDASLATGAYSAGWPAAFAVYQQVLAASWVPAVTVGDSTTNLFFALCSNTSTAGTARVDYKRIRILQ